MSTLFLAQEVVEPTTYDLCMTIGESRAETPATPARQFAWLRVVLRDVMVAGAVIVGLWLTVIPPPTVRGWQLMLAGLCLVAVVCRNRLPVAMTVIATASTLTAWVVGITADPCVLVGMCLFAVAERRGNRLFPWWVLTATGLVGIIMLLIGGEDAQTGIRVVIVSAIVLSAAWALGTRTRQVRRESAARARADERLRMVREVHDVLSHSLGTIGVQAGIAAHVETLGPAELRATLREVEEDARSSLSELRELLRREREDIDSTPGAPFGEVIDSLTRSLERASIRANVDLTGDVNALSAVHRQTIRRIVQEGITNVIRHSGATVCWIGVHAGDDALTVTVRDDGHGSDSAFREGNGLTGLRERTALLDGRMHLQDSRDGVTLTVQLPLTGGVGT